ncbi:transglutaminase-like domain-containing protein [Dyadobacter sp. 32]|uniref:transglutaminase-like domain-containing protein n=1 Tax=Dyadobacter sp. 32 TaxID=538966 RepID=UPI0039C5D24E
MSMVLCLNGNLYNCFTELKRLCLVLISIIFGACQSYPDNIELALEHAGENRNELIKALEHYSADGQDSLKRRAMFFLVANMPGHSSYDGDVLDKYDQIFSIIADFEKVKPLVGSIHYPVVYASWDSLSNLYGPLKTENLNVVDDSRKISSELLVENVEYAFKAWKMPWAVHLTFDEFSEYVLPYRFQNEKIESWRPIFWQRFAWLKDSMQNSTDPVRACELINNDIKSWFRFNEVFNRYPRAISPMDMLKCKMGKCLDQAAVATYAMRAMGIPVAHEFVPQWADRSMGHDFSSVLNKDRRFVDFLGGELPPGKNEIRNVAPKIYRSMFAWQRGEVLDADELRLAGLTSPFIKDVTSNYVPVSKITLTVNSLDLGKDRRIFLCVFNNRVWVPVSFVKAVGNKAIFENLGRGVIYLPIVFKNGVGKPADSPFILHKDGHLEKIDFNSQLVERVNLERKYPLNGLKIWWLTLMGGGRFEGANRSDFRDAAQLHTIPDTIPMQMNFVNLTNPGEFRYLRYCFPDNKSGSLGEISFYGSPDETSPMRGSWIWSPGVDSSDVRLAFDGKIDAFVDKTPNNLYNGLWIGMDLGNAKEITRVGYSPRNDRNSIMAGMTYELFCWRDEWVSLGKILTTKDGTISFGNVPSGALLLLRNHTEGQEERIFQYKDGRQIWW